jgi:predicted  nucleic acid-binding Zn-ribbon protein
VLEQKKQELETKKAELNSIIEETKKEEAVLEKTSVEAAKLIEDRLFQAYKKVRDNARNGLAVVAIQRDSCGGCFNKIPPQRQLDIRQHKKVIVCEHCGRILVDSKIIEN